MPIVVPAPRDVALEAYNVFLIGLQQDRLRREQERAIATAERKEEQKKIAIAGGTLAGAAIGAFAAPALLGATPAAQVGTIGSSLMGPPVGAVAGSALSPAAATLLGASVGGQLGGGIGQLATGDVGGGATSITQAGLQAITAPAQAQVHLEEQDRQIANEILAGMGILPSEFKSKLFPQLKKEFPDKIKTHSDAFRHLASASQDAAMMRKIKTASEIDKRKQLNERVMQIGDALAADPTGSGVLDRSGGKNIEKWFAATRGLDALRDAVNSGEIDSRDSEEILRKTQQFQQSQLDMVASGDLRLRPPPPTQKQRLERGETGFITEDGQRAVMLNDKGQAFGPFDLKENAPDRAALIKMGFKPNQIGSAVVKGDSVFITAPDGTSMGQRFLRQGDELTLRELQFGFSVAPDVGHDLATGELRRLTPEEKFQKAMDAAQMASQISKRGLDPRAIEQFKTTPAIQPGGEQLALSNLMDKHGNDAATIRREGGRKIQQAAADRAASMINFGEQKGKLHPQEIQTIRLLLEIAGDVEPTLPAGSPGQQEPAAGTTP